MHGLAASAALVLLAVASAPSTRIGLLYILVSSAGSVVGMGLVSALMMVPLRLSSPRFSALHRQVRAGLGAVTIAIGREMVHSIALAGF